MKNMNDKIFFSIIICCYNSEKYLEDTLKSVVGQTFSDWELIIIDEKIVNKFIDKYKELKVSYFYQNNKGYPSARNKGLDFVKGKWICLLDHDDLMKPNRLEVQFNNINNNSDCKLFSSNSDHIDKNGNFIKLQYSIFNPKEIKNKKESYGIQLLKYGCFIGTETAIFENNIIKDIGRFNEKYQFISDYDFFIRIGMKYDFFLSEQVLSAHRVHINNTQHYYFKTGKGYLEYAKLYFLYFYNHNLNTKNKIYIIRRIFLYLFYWFARKLLNNKYIFLIYSKLKKII